jgi:hypothetical protein
MGELGTDEACSFSDWVSGSLEHPIKTKVNDKSQNTKTTHPENL